MTEPDGSVGRQSPKFMLRLPDGMRERVAEAAKRNGRSMNAEIVASIEGSFERTTDRRDERIQELELNTFKLTELLTKQTAALETMKDAVDGLIALEDSSIRRQNQELEYEIARIKAERELLVRNIAGPR